MKQPTLVFTGGHHTSSLEVALELKNKGFKVVWFGHKYSIWGDANESAEYQEVLAAGIPFYNLHAGKLYNTHHPLKLIRIPWGFVEAFFLLLKTRPQGIVSFGGYLAVPTVIMGYLLGICSITHEQTTSGGWANRLVGLFAQKIYLTFPDSKNIFPPQKTEVIGLPLPKGLKLSPVPAPKPTIFVTGGKQGSHQINTHIFSLLPKLLRDYTVIHQTGNSSLYHDFQTAQKIKKDLSPQLSDKYFPVKYFYKSDFIHHLTHCSLVVGRSGAHFVYYLGLVGKPCVLIPLPDSSHSEQLSNALFLEKQGNAVVLPQSSLSADSMHAAIIRALTLSSSPLPLPKDATTRLVSQIPEVFGL